MEHTVFDFERRQQDLHRATAADVAREYVNTVVDEFLPGREFYVTADMARFALAAPMSSSSAMSFENLWARMGELLEDEHADIVPPVPTNMATDFWSLTEVNEPGASFEYAPPRDERALAVLTMISAYGLSVEHVGA